MNSVPDPRPVMVEMWVCGRPECKASHWTEEAARDCGDRYVRNQRRTAHIRTRQDRVAAMRQAGMTYKAIGGVLGVSATRAREIHKSYERRVSP